MTFNHRLLASTNRHHFRAFHRLLVCAVVVATAVLAGSILIGDSVRGTLQRKVYERLGNAQSIVLSTHGYLHEEWLQKPPFNGQAKGYLFFRGFIAHQGLLVPVNVWGTDHLPLHTGQCQLNPKLNAHLSLTEGEEIVLRLPVASPVPTGSLFVTKTHTTSTTLRLAGIRSVEEGGNLSLSNEQTTPFNLFLSRQELAQTVGIEGKVNLIFSEQRLTSTDLDTAWNPSFAGFSVQPHPSVPHQYELLAERIFLPQPILDSLSLHSSRATPHFSYLVNSIDCADQSIPYSFTTATDSYLSHTLQPNETILSDYAAHRLECRVGDSLSVAFFVTSDLKTLSEQRRTFRVSKIIPLAAMHADATLSAKYPGLTNVERCTDWDSDLPIDLHRITPQDEAYWDNFRSTPKLLLPYSTMAPLWSNSYGAATALRFSTEGGSPAQHIRPAACGITLLHPQEQALEAARSGIDFSSLFLALGCFIIAASLILITLPMEEMVAHRREELQLLRAIGFTQRRIQQLLFMELAPRLALFSLLGIGIAIAYTTVVLWLLSTLWGGATHTDQLTPTLLPLSLVYSYVGSLALLLGSTYLSIRRATKEHPSPPHHRPTPQRLHRQRLPLLLLLHNRPQEVKSLIALLFGVIVVLMVGLHREGISPNDEGTKGYNLWCETAVPLHHNLSTSEGRNAVGLQHLPADVQVTQLFRHHADEAGCLNLNRPIRPSLLGMDEKQLTSLTDQFSSPNALTSTLPNETPIVVDATVLQWSLMKQLGDTLHYTTDDGATHLLRIVGSIDRSIFQGYILTTTNAFQRLHPTLTGSDLMLLTTPPSATETTAQLLARSLYDYGITLTPTAQRLEEYNSVTNAYLTIFMTLGSIGLLLGMVIFLVVVRKKLLRRADEIELLRALGFTDDLIIQLLFRENILIPHVALIGGTTLSVLLVLLLGTQAGGALWIMATLIVGGLLLLSTVTIRLFVTHFVHPSHHITNPSHQPSK